MYSKRIFALSAVELEYLDRLRGDLVQRAFKLLAGVLELVSDVDMLRAVRLTLAAADAVGGGGGVFAHGGTHEVVHLPAEPALGVAAVISGEGAGDVHVLRAEHTVAAAGAADLHFGIDGLHHLTEHLLIAAFFDHP